MQACGGEWLHPGEQRRDGCADTDRRGRIRRRTERTCASATARPAAPATANIAATLAGAARLVKTDLGTLVLSGVNTYAGGTVVKSGTLQVAQNLNLGAASGALSLDGGTLAATASFNTGRAITLGAGSGGINVMGAATDLGVTSAIGGSGAIDQAGRRLADAASG